MLNDQPHVCDDAGRRMFYDYVGRYFDKPTALQPLPPGTRCSVCGATGCQLYSTSTGAAICGAQRVITSKRAGRKSAEEPPVPSNGGGMVAFSEGSLVVAGPSVARVWTKLLPAQTLPPNIELIFSEKGVIAKALASIVRDPPPPPFVVLLFGKAAAFEPRITVDTSRIAVNGPDAFSIDRPRMLRLLDLVSGVPTKDLVTAVTLRARLVVPPASDADRQALADVRQRHPILAQSIASLPSPDSDDWTALKRLLAE